MPNQSHKNKSLSWRTTPDDEKPKNATWSEDGLVKKYSSTFEDYLKNQFVETIKFRLYNDKSTGAITLEDVENNLTFTLPKDGKTKGYIIAYKLYSKEV